MLQRKYEVIDAAVPSDIAAASAAVTKNADTDVQKARALYDWVGSRIAYDWDKANNYVDHGIWHEQTPIETFSTRKGVCIDVARLYAVMARSAGLQVRVVTGQGATGDGKLRAPCLERSKADGRRRGVDSSGRYLGRIGQLV